MNTKSSFTPPAYRRYRINPMKTHTLTLAFRVVKKTNKLKLTFNQFPSSQGTRLFAVTIKTFLPNSHTLRAAVWMNDRSLHQSNELINPYPPGNPREYTYTVPFMSTVTHILIHTHTHQGGFWALLLTSVTSHLWPHHCLARDWPSAPWAEQWLVDSGRQVGGNPRCKKKKKSIYRYI